MAKAPKAKYYFTYDMLEEFDFCEYGIKSYKRSFPKQAEVNRSTVKKAYAKGFRHFRYLSLGVWNILLQSGHRELAAEADEQYVALLDLDEAGRNHVLTDAEADFIVDSLNKTGDVIAKARAEGAL